jgi:hypothetical protein
MFSLFVCYNEFGLADGLGAVMQPLGMFAGCVRYPKLQTEVGEATTITVT